MPDTGNAAAAGETSPVYSHAGGSLSMSGPVLVSLIRDVFLRELPFRFSAPGTSMSPFIQNNDVITIAPYIPSSCSPGIVVAFLRPGTERLVVHRVVSMTGNGCRIRGDNTAEDDREIPHERILGQVIRIERNGKTIRFGLGPERRIIALFSRRGWLPACIGAAGKIVSVIRRLT